MPDYDPIDDLTALRDRILAALPEAARLAARDGQHPAGLPSLAWRNGVRHLAVHVVGPDEVHCSWGDDGPGTVESRRPSAETGRIAELVAWCLEGE